MKPVKSLLFRCTKQLNKKKVCKKNVFLQKENFFGAQRFFCGSKQFIKHNLISSIIDTSIETETN